MADALHALRQRYPLTELRVQAAGRAWQVTAVQDQESLIRDVRTERDLEQFPYGLMLWASAVGLARFLESETSLFHGKRVLELGAGVGLVGQVAQWLGGSVTQTDCLEDALTLCRYNADRNGVGEIDVAFADWRDFPESLADFPLVLGSDILYERSLHPALFRLLPRVIAPGGTLLISDPLRPQALEFADAVERSEQWTIRMTGSVVLWENQRKDIALFCLQRRS